MGELPDRVAYVTEITKGVATIQILPRESFLSSPVPSIVQRDLDEGDRLEYQEVVALMQEPAGPGQIWIYADIGGHYGAFLFEYRRFLQAIALTDPEPLGPPLRRVVPSQPAPAINTRSTRGSN